MTDVSLNTFIDEHDLSNEQPTTHNQCPNCKKIFSKSSNLHRHMNNKVCYSKKDLSMIDLLKKELKEKLRKELMEEFKNTISDMRKEIEDLKKENIIEKKSRN
jgi:hypothetical protein